MPEWRLLTNHGLVLSYISRHPRTTARELADAVAITERAARKIIADLLETGYLTRKREGRRNRYRINPELALRHPTHSETAVGDLLEVLGWKRRSPRARAR